MWTPAAASVVARLVLREGFTDVSFRIGGSRGWKAIMLALIFPIVFGLISYGIAWTTGLVHFNPQPIALAARFVGDSAPPIVAFTANLAAAATVVTIQPPYCCRRRNRLARIHAHAANRCWSAESRVSERID